MTFSHNMRELLASDRSEAKEAIDLFCYRMVREIGSLAAAIGGLDALVFTGGIGEHAAPVREQICSKLGWLGLEFDAIAYAEKMERIAMPWSSRPTRNRCSHVELLDGRPTQMPAISSAAN